MQLIIIIQLNQIEHKSDEKELYSIVNFTNS